MKRNQAPYYFVFPALLLYLGLFLIPSSQSFYYSFTNWNGYFAKYDFIGFRNFVRIFHDERFTSAFSNTIYYAIALTVGQNAVGLLLALLLNVNMRTKNMFRALFFTPVILTPIVVGYLFSYILNPIDGVLNRFLKEMGLGILAKNWLGDFDLALPSIITVNVWIGAGFSMVIYLANLQSIPKELLEASSIDGASRMTRFRHILFPLLAPSFTITMVLTMIAGLQAFDLVIAMTDGGPGNSSRTLSFVLYALTFRDNSSFSYGIAMGIILFLAVLVISVIQLLILRRREVEM